MQLTRAAAGAVALLAIAVMPAAHERVARADESSAWRVGADTLVYTDTDNVLVVSPQVSVRRAVDEDGGAASARVVVDVVSAASVDVVSQATNRFSEVRSEADLGISKSIHGLLPSLAYHYSHEPDYLSNGFGAGLERRLGGADTTVHLGYDVTFDRVGMTGTPASAFSESLVSHEGTLTLTQVLGQNNLLRGVYTLTVQRGYMEKPYRFVPLFDREGIEAARAAGVTLDLSTFDQYRLPDRIAEAVPDLRVGHAFAVRWVRYLGSIAGSLHLDAQLFADSWGILAQTVEPTVVWRWSPAITLSGYARGYLQKAAGFWRREYVVDDPSTAPRWRTLDRELSGYFTGTGGARLEWQRGSLSAYVDGSAGWTRYSQYLFLTDRLALVGQLGLRLGL